MSELSVLSKYCDVTCWFHFNGFWIAVQFSHMVSTSIHCGYYVHIYDPEMMKATDFGYLLDF